MPIIANRHTLSPPNRSPDSKNKSLPSRTSSTPQTQHKEDKVDIVVAGSLAIDFSCDYSPFADKATSLTPTLHTSNPAIISQNLGGVGHNVALAAHYVGGRVLFCSVVGDDPNGQAALSALETEGIGAEGIRLLSSSRTGARTARYVAVNDAKKDLLVAMADMGILELSAQDLDVDTFWGPLLARAKPKWIVLDANWSPDVLSKWVTISKIHNARVAFEPVSITKATRLFEENIIKPSDCAPENHKVHLAAPNELELAAMYQAARDKGLFDAREWWAVIDSFGMSSSGSRDRFVSITSSALVEKGIPQQCVQLLPFIPCILTKLGRHGVLLTQMLQPGDPRLTSPDYAAHILARCHVHSTSSGNRSLIGGVYMRLFPPERTLKDSDVVSVNGAGDTLLGVVIAGLVKASESLASPGLGLNIEEVISIAQQASLKTLQSAQSVSRDIEGLRERLKNSR